MLEQLKGGILVLMFKSMWSRMQKNEGFYVRSYIFEYVAHYASMKVAYMLAVAEGVIKTSLISSIFL